MTATHALLKVLRWPFRALLPAILLAAGAARAEPLADGARINGWTILSNSEPDDLAVIDAAPAYHINHLQLSHLVVSDLREIKDDARAGFVNRLVDHAHRAGIVEVVLWDHALYDLNYYPAKFRTGPNGTINLDAPEFWAWLKADYRRMLDRVPHADGLVLTFISTGARAEQQFSEKMLKNEEKIAAVVNAVADVVIGERHLSLYARTLSSTHEDYDNILRAINLFKYPQIRLMMKETTEDTFLTHPQEVHAGAIDRPTLLEFDPTGEFNGQGVIAGTFAEFVLQHWRNMAARPHIIGYTARTDRFGNTRLIGTPGEINLYALRRAVEDPQVTAEQVHDEFIAAHYGAAAVPEVKAAFKDAFDIISCALYTLGNSSTNHSHLEFEPFATSYINYAAGKWIDPPIIYLGHGLNREVHTWRDVIDHIIPAFAKDPAQTPWQEVPTVWPRGWVHPGEGMDEPTLRAILVEKKFGVDLAEDALRHIENARAALAPGAYKQLHAYFERTLLTARLQAATASAYFGFRTWCRNETQRTPFVRAAVKDGLREMQELVPLIRNYPVKPPVGQWDWSKDADLAEIYMRWITDGWPASPAAELAELQKVIPGDPPSMNLDDRRSNYNAGVKFLPGD